MTQSPRVTTNAHVTEPQTVPLTLVKAPAPAVQRKPAKRGKVSAAAKKHRGVKLVKPSGPKSPSWRLRYVDPETGKARFERVPAEYVGTFELRHDYAVKVFNRIHGRRNEIAAGAAPHTAADMLIADAFDRYFETWGLQKRPSTQKAYRRGVNRFLAWCALPAIGVRSTRQVTRGILRAYAGACFAAKLDARVGRAGQRATATANKDLKWLAAVLSELRRGEYIALTRDDLAEGLRRQKEKTSKRGFHESPALRAILAACRDHDADEYGGAFAGRMLSVVLFVLLTGMRAAEALGVEWRDVFVGSDGCTKIRVRAEVAKTGRERIIDTAHSPLLAHLVSAPAGRVGTLLGGSEDTLYEARRRVIDESKAPEFEFQELRCSCGSYLTCSPAIFGTASAYMSAAQLGHSARIAEKHYVNAVKVPHTAKSTEAAMALELKAADVPTL